MPATASPLEHRLPLFEQSESLRPSAAVKLRPLNEGAIQGHTLEYYALAVDT
jgi:hypothetical protein